MGLVKVNGASDAVYIRPDDVTAISWGTLDKECTAVHIRGESEPWLVKGTPDEVHAALFPPRFQRLPLQEQTEAADKQRAQAIGGGVDPQFWVPVDREAGYISQEQAVATLEQGAAHRGLTSETWTRLGRLAYPGTSGLILPADVAEALNPTTYAQEWENHSPNCVRAMAWALGLVRARLGVGT